MAGDDAASRLFDLLGTDVMSAQAAKELGRYPALRRAGEDVALDDGDATVRYLRSERDGLLIKVSDDGEILAIFLMSEGKDGFSQFRGELPGHLTFASTPAEVLKTLGAPAYSRPPGKVGSFEHGDLLRFDRPGHSLHFQFRSDRRGLLLVTAMAARAVPGRASSRES